METEYSYQVGYLLNWNANDPEFSTLGECFRFTKYEDPDMVHTYGIWTGQKQGSELVAIVHEGQYFKAF